MNAWYKDLSFGKTKFEEYDNGERIAVIPLEGDYSKNNNLAGDIISNVVLIFNNAGNIRRGNIVLYQPKDNEQFSKLTEHAFYDVFNTAERKCNGQFKFLLVDGKLGYQVAYNNGLMISLGEVKPASALNIVNPSAKKVCTDWYLITTYYYYSDGTTQTTQEYITTTCSDTQSLVQDPAGEGLELAITKTWTWNVGTYFNGALVVNSGEKVKGKKVSSEQQGGHFTSIVHNGSYILGGLSYYGWRESSAVVSAGGQSASATVSGVADAWTKEPEIKSNSAVTSFEAMHF